MSNFLKPTKLKIISFLLLFLFMFSFLPKNIFGVVFLIAVYATSCLIVDIVHRKTNDKQKNNGELVYGQTCTIIIGQSRFYSSVFSVEFGRVEFYRDVLCLKNTELFFSKIHIYNLPVVLKFTEIDSIELMKRKKLFGSEDVIFGIKINHNTNNPPYITLSNMGKHKINKIVELFKNSGVIEAKSNFYSRIV